ncbi:synaptic vesicle transporter SVOP [Aspergillus oryzae 100-8]|uniref:Synaptic vesicle transporter SVOP n=1 Tax=Aspergillus oryzae (strain 3.042) TaxID=1160506 RepID=I8TPA9_ASPO3|nr:synaptic vesicle transporter SVOP [Aspergillus oryzae 3.042]KDE81987.1 synaptic vesicle transporter SVOP [Aspergillus oryzae 100-8]|eukprot:EIT75808.1 synaptic vesicle transporter SVOP [Aspergillus oryzae 3.042]
MDPENQSEWTKPACERHIPFWRQVIDQGAITQDVLHHNYPGSGTETEPFLVSWLPDDPRNPMLFTTFKKVGITVVVSTATLAVALASSAYSGSTKQVMEGLDVGTEVATLGLSLFVIGFALGPLFWAPLSEFIGRQYPFIVSFGAMTVFLAGCAGAQNIQTLLVLRFLAGTAGSSPLTNAGGVISDMFRAEQRGLALCLFAAAPFMGPVIGPVIGGFLGMNAGWKWVEGFLAALSGVLWLMMACFVPETYAPVLLRQRAKRLSQKTGMVYRSKLDVENEGSVSLKRMFATSLLRPWVLLFREPIVFMLSIYIAIIYGALFMMFAAFPIVYQRGRGWNQGVGGLAFMGIAVGMIVGTIYTIPDNRRYTRTVKRHGGFAPPESRLPPVMLSAVCIPVGLFWFAWTNSPSVHWMASIAAGVPFGCGIVLLYLGIMGYLIDSYTIFAASVLAANAVLRSLFGGIFPLFTAYMYEGLGIHWASSIPAFLTVACMPFPFIFYRYGEAIRKRCPYSAQSEVYVRKLQVAAQQSSVSVADADTDAVHAAIDGRVWFFPESDVANGWDTPAGNGSELWYQISFESSTKTASAEIAFFANSTQGFDAPEKYSIQVNVSGEWAEVSNANYSSPVANGITRATWDGVDADKIRLVFAPQEEKKVRLVEFKVFGEVVAEN